MLDSVEQRLRIFVDPEINQELSNFSICSVNYIKGNLGGFFDFFLSSDTRNSSETGEEAPKVLICAMN